MFFIPLRIFTSISLFFFLPEKIDERVKGEINVRQGNGAEFFSPFYNIKIVTIGLCISEKKKFRKLLSLIFFLVVSVCVL